MLYIIVSFDCVGQLAWNFELSPQDGCTSRAKLQAQSVQSPTAWSMYAAHKKHVSHDVSKGSVLLRLLDVLAA